MIGAARILAENVGSVPVFQEQLASLSQGRVTTAAIAILAGIGLIVYGISILAGKHWSMLHNVILIVLFASYRHAKWLFCVVQ